MCIRDSPGAGHAVLADRKQTRSAGEAVYNAAAKNSYEQPSIQPEKDGMKPVSYTHLRAHETVLDLVCRLLLEKKKKNTVHNDIINIHTIKTRAIKATKEYS